MCYTNFFVYQKCYVPCPAVMFHVSDITTSVLSDADNITKTPLSGGAYLVNQMMGSRGFVPTSLSSIW